MTSKKVWFIRHGESVANARGVSSDPALVPLTEVGHAQAEKLVGDFSIAPDLIVTSPYIRTKETVRPLLQLYPDAPCEEWPVHEFTYISPSRCKNTTMTDRKPMVEEYWQKADPHHCDGVGAESFSNLIDRGRSCLSMLRARQERFIAVFTHGQFMAAVKWILEKDGDTGNIYDLLAFRKFISVLAPRNGQKIEVFF